MRGGVAVATVLALGLALAGAMTLGERRPPPGAGGGIDRVDDAVVELDRETVGTDRASGQASPDDRLVEDASCRRSDTTRSRCGPHLPVGIDDSEALLVLGDDLAVIADGDELVGIELGVGSEQWRTEAFVGARAIRAASDEELLVAAVAGGLVAVELATGEIRWTAPFTADPSGEPTAPPSTSITPVPVWLGDDGVLAQDPTGRLHAFERQNGARRWVQPIEDRVMVATSRGLLAVGPDGLRMWHPDGPDHRWRRSGSDLRLHRTVGAWAPSRPDEVVAGPLPLTSGRWLVDLDGGMVPVPSVGPVEVVLAGEVTVAVTWPGGVPGDDEAPSDVEDGPSAAAAIVTTFDARGEQRWQHHQVPLACCEVRAVPSARGELVLTTGAGLPAQVVLMDAANGRIQGLPRREGATLEALTPEQAVWRNEGGLVGLDRRTGREAFRANGTVSSVDPLVIQGARRSIVVHTVGPIAPSDAARSGPRSGPDPSGTQGRGTAS